MYLYKNMKYSQKIKQNIKYIQDIKNINKIADKGHGHESKMKKIRTEQ